MNKIKLKYTRKALNYGKKTITSYYTKGVIDYQNSFILLSFYDVELKKNVQIIYNGSNEVLVRSTSLLKFTLSKENMCHYQTTYGNIIVKTTTTKISWLNNCFFISYSLHSSEQLIGKFEIEIKVLGNLFDTKDQGSAKDNHGN